MTEKAARTINWCEYVSYIGPITHRYHLRVWSFKRTRQAGTTGAFAAPGECSHGGQHSPTSIALRRCRGPSDQLTIHPSWDADHEVVHHRLRDAAKRSGQTLAIMADLQGPKIRLVRAVGEPNGNTGESVTVTVADVLGTRERVCPPPTKGSPGTPGRATGCSPTTAGSAWSSRPPTATTSAARSPRRPRHGHRGGPVSNDKGPPFRHERGSVPALSGKAAAVRAGSGDRAAGGVPGRERRRPSGTDLQTAWMASFRPPGRRAASRAGSGLGLLPPNPRSSPTTSPAPPCCPTTASTSASSSGIRPGGGISWRSSTRTRRERRLRRGSHRSDPDLPGLRPVGAANPGLIGGSARPTRPVDARVVRSGCAGVAPAVPVPVLHVNRGRSRRRGGGPVAVWVTVVAITRAGQDVTYATADTLVRRGGSGHRVRPHPRRRTVQRAEHLNPSSRRAQAGGRVPSRWPGADVSSADVLLGIGGVSVGVGSACQDETRPWPPNLAAHAQADADDRPVTDDQEPGSSPVIRWL